MDPVDQLVGELHQQSCVFCRLELAEPWRIQKTKSSVAPFYLVLSGDLRVAAANAAVDLQQGDFLVLPQGDAHEFSGRSSSGAKGVSLLALFADNGIEPWKPGMRYRTVAISYGGPAVSTVLLVGLFDFGEAYRNPLLTTLPKLLVAHAASADAAPWLLSTGAAIQNELEKGQPGSSLAIAKLADLLLVNTIRGHLQHQSTLDAGWLKGTTDPVVGAALSAMHEHPEREWTLQLLASHVGYSRAAFASRFSAVVGQGALTYLTSWRMHLAAEMLAKGEDNVSEIAGRIGYRAGAFTNAFRRWFGKSPREYRADRTKQSRSKRETGPNPTEQG